MGGVQPDRPWGGINAGRLAGQPRRPCSRRAQEATGERATAARLATQLAVASPALHAALHAAGMRSRLQELSDALRR